MEKNIKYAICALSGACLVALTGCQSPSGQNGGWEQSDSSEPTAEAVQEGQSGTDGSQENGQVETEQGKTEGEQHNTDASRPATPEVETVEYSHDDLYLSVDIPDGWGYRVRSAEELEKEDGFILCAIDFWPQEYPAAVFSLEYMPCYGICGTGVTSTEFTLANGLGGWRHTEEIEDTLWLNIYFNNVENVESPEAYVIEATPDLKTWDAIQPEFEKILESVWVGTRSGSAGGMDERS